MKKTKILAGLLCIMLLATTMTVVPVTAAETSVTWAEFIDEMELASTVDFATAGTVMTKEADNTYPSNTIEQAKTKGVLSIAENGAMTLKDVTGTGWGVSYKPSSNLLANLGTDGLMHFSITYGESGNHKGQMKLSSGTKMLHMVFEDAQVVVYGENDDHVVFPNHSSYPGKTYDYVVKTDGSSYQFWSKESSETAYTYAGISALKSSGLANEIYMFANNQITINSMEFYKVDTTKTWDELADGLQVASTVDFATAGKAMVYGEGTYPTITVEEAIAQNVLSIADNGAMTVDATEESTWGASYKPSGYPLANLTDGGLLHFSITYGNTADKIGGQMKLSNGTTMLYVTFGNGNVQAQVHNGTENTSIAFPNHGDMLGKTYDYVVKADGSSYHFYSKESNESAYTYAGTSGLRAGNGSEVYMGVGKVITINSMEFYAPYTTEAELLGDMKLAREMTFPDAAAFAENGSLTAGSAGEAKNGKLVLGESTTYQTKQHFSFPQGTALKFNMKFTALGSGSDSFNMNIHADGKRLRFRVGKDNMCIGHNTALGVTTAENIAYDYLVFYKESGYEVWRKTENDLGYTCIGTGCEVLDSGDAYTVIQSLSGCNIEVGYIEKYIAGIEWGEELVRFADGADLTRTATNGGKLSYPAGLRAIVKEGVSGKLLFIGYTDDHRMVKAQIVDAADATQYPGTKYDLTAKNLEDISYIRVYLWDGFTTMNPVDGYTTPTFLTK